MRSRSLSRPRPARRPLLAALTALLAAALGATGCVSMPSGGPVLSYPVTQGATAQNQPNLQIQSQPPRPNWSPTEIVQGFLTASANFGNYPQVALAYLTPDEQKVWNPAWSAVVYKSGPNVMPATYPSTAKNPVSATVRVTGTIQASLQGNGLYSVPSASTRADSSDKPQPFKLAKVGGQWRIADAPGKLLLTSNSFANDYQLRNLYFFDPLGKFLVPDPVYVPLRGDLMGGLVNELISPPTDWLSFGATKTAFPAKTKVSSVVLDGVTAVVNLTGAAIGKASSDPNSGVMQQVSAQLLLTLLSGAGGQGVQSVEVVVNGKPWTPAGPPGSQSNPVQTSPRWKPATGASTEFYTVDSKGNLIRRGTATGGGQPVTMARIGTGYDQIAVSADGAFLAALRDGILYTGSPAGGSLTKRGTGFVTMSWDANDNLWASEGSQIVVFRGTSNPRQPLGQLTPVDLEDVTPQTSGPYTELQVAPDGVRVAIVSGNELTFGAISRQQGQTVIAFSPVAESPLTQPQAVPVNANFTALTWYGPDYVIALANAGPSASVTEYPVGGATPVPVQAEDGMQTITAAWGQPLIAGLQNGRIVVDPNITGSWTPLNDGDTPAKGSVPTYPG